MPYYLCECPECGKKQQKFSSILNRPKPLVCKDCNCDMKQLGVVEPEEIISEEINGEFVFVCPQCDDELRLTKQPAEIISCEKCGCYMDRILDKFVEFYVGDKEYFNPIHSDSLAIMPSQVAGHKKMFPDVEIDKEGRPTFTSVKQHDRYIKKIGVEKVPQKIKAKGKRIA